MRSGFLVRWYGLLALLAVACGDFGPDDVSARWEVESVNGAVAPGSVPVFTGDGIETLDISFDRFRFGAGGADVVNPGVPCGRTYAMHVSGDSSEYMYQAFCTFALSAGDPPVAITISFTQPEDLVPGHPLVGLQTLVGRIGRDVMMLEIPAGSGGQTNVVKYRRARDP